MESTDISPHFKTTSLAVPSPNASHIACLFGARLQIRCLASFEIIRSISLPSSHDLRSSCVSWSPPALPAPQESSTPPRRKAVARSYRVLIADNYTTRVYDLRDHKWNAVISNGSGGMGKNIHVEFGASEDEVVVFSDFTSKVSVWCLKTGRTVEIKDPKYTGREGKGWGYRPVAKEAELSGDRTNGVLAMLCRTAGQDVLLLLAPQTYNVLKRVELQTIDAVGLKWSRDGRWIAVWDAPSSGYKLCIYTADGHLYRTLHREPSEDPSEWGVEGLGIKTVDWVPGNKWLAVGGWDRRVRILSTKTFSPVVFLDHTPIIHVPTAPVYTEQVDAQGNREYSLTQQPITPPKAPIEKNETALMKQGISILSFNSEGTLCATRDDSTPTTVWVWDLTTLRPRTILTQHSPIKSLYWHHSNPSCLLIQTAHDSPTVYLYTVSQPLTNSLSSSAFTPGPPEILSFASEINKPASSVPTKWTTNWLPTPVDKKPAFSLGHQQGYILIWPEGKDQILRFEREDGEESDDSLYDILTGRTPIPRLHDSDSGSRQSSRIEDSGRFEGVIDEEPAEMTGYEGSTGSLSFDDTFREKRRKASGSASGMERGRSVFDESGLDEMF